MKLKAVFDQTQIHSRDRVALLNYHQQFKCITTWFLSMDCQSAIYSIENSTKAVKRLPVILCESIYKATKDFSFVSGEVTLIEFERWLESCLKKYFNLIPNMITRQEKIPKASPCKAKTNVKTTDRKSTDKQIVCLLCNQPHRLIECEKCIKRNLQERKKLVSTNKL